MIRIRHIRFWTMLLTGALSAYPLMQALPLILFGVSEPLADGANATARLGGYIDSSPLGFLARQKLIELVEIEDPGQRLEDVAGLLNRTPTAGSAWLQLATAHYASGASPEKIASALALSHLTAPNEAEIMAGRALFGLPLWTALPPDSRRGLIGDLVNGWDAVAEGGRTGLKAGLSLAPDQMRQEIRAALLLWGKAGVPVETALGLKPSAKVSDVAPGSHTARPIAPPLPSGALSPALSAPPASLVPASEPRGGGR